MKNKAIFLLCAVCLAMTACGKTKVIDMNKYICIRDYLRVPDPENYTEEDIYDCLLGLLQEYEGEKQE